jgi:hypothetical protein
MRIIAESSGGYVAEISHDELLKICGFPSQYSDAFKEFAQKHNVYAMSRTGPLNIAVPCSIPVSDWWNRMSEIRRREEQLTNMADTLRGLADLVGGAWPAIKAELPIDANTESSS